MSVKYYLIKYTQLNVAGTKRYPGQYVMAISENQNWSHDRIKEWFRDRHRVSKVRIMKVEKIDADRAERIRKDERQWKPTVGRYP